MKKCGTENYILPAFMAFDIPCGGKFGGVGAGLNTGLLEVSRENKVSQV